MGIIYTVRLGFPEYVKDENGNNDYSKPPQWFTVGCHSYAEARAICQENKLDVSEIQKVWVLEETRGYEAMGGE